MRIGTRVIHRRYAWIGVVTGNPVLGIVSVKWENRYGAVMDEYLTDIRPTPIQP